jgi:hypothetical protein
MQQATSKAAQLECNGDMHGINNMMENLVNFDIAQL